MSRSNRRARPSFQTYIRRIALVLLFISGAMMAVAAEGGAAEAPMYRDPATTRLEVFVGVAQADLADLRDVSALK